MTSLKRGNIFRNDRIPHARRYEFENRRSVCLFGHYPIMPTQKSHYLFCTPFCSSHRTAQESQGSCVQTKSNLETSSSPATFNRKLCIHILLMTTPLYSDFPSFMHSIHWRPRQGNSYCARDICDQHQQGIPSVFYQASMASLNSVDPTMAIIERNVFAHQVDGVHPRDARAGCRKQYRGVKDVVALQRERFTMSTFPR